MYWMADALQEVMNRDSVLQVESRSKKGKLRGVDSYGMMCSIEELGSDRNMYPEAPEYGIYILMMTQLSEKVQ